MGRPCHLCARDSEAIRSAGNQNQRACNTFRLTKASADADPTGASIRVSSSNDETVTRAIPKTFSAVRVPQGT